MFKLVCITNRKLCKRDFFEVVNNVVTTGVGLDDSNLPRPDMVILREKDLSEEEYYELAKKVKSICDKAEIELVIHTHVNVARKLGIRKIHLPLREYIMLTEEEKNYFDNIGTSVHSLEDLDKAISLGVTYVLAGHIYDTDCKKGLPGRGLEFLQEICNNSSMPVIAIGGINMDRLKEVKEVGASGAAIMSGYMNI